LVIWLFGHFQRSGCWAYRRIVRELRGIPVSSGIAIGQAFILDEQRQRVSRKTVAREMIPIEVKRLNTAIKESIAELIDVRSITHTELGEEAAKIFGFHIGMLSDPSLTKPMQKMVEDEAVTAEFAVSHTLSQLAERFSALKDAAFKTKVDDVHDLSMRLLTHLIGAPASRLAKLDHPAIIVAKDLTPSQAASFDRKRVLGFVTEAGGKTGHTGIFARAIGIPAVVGGHGIIDAITDGTRMIIDGESGSIIIDPDQATLERYARGQERDRLFRIELSQLRDLPAVTRDGVPIEILGNIEFPEEIEGVLAAGGVGVGLYRTEYLYLSKPTAPTEEEHFQAYKRCVELLAGKPITIRTMDLGADKYAGARLHAPERNPMLGCRSIRYCLLNQPMFKSQLRAILRVSALGPVRIMFPLVTTPEEFRRAKFITRDVMEDLADEGLAFDRGISIGMMVEVPAAALCARQFTQDAGFFSIGTNDLVQYTLAVDRTNDLVAPMFNPANPAVAQLISTTVEAAAAAKISVSCCGESAGELDHAMLLMGLGLRSLSASAPALPALKRMVRSVTIDDCKRVAEKAMSLDSDAAVLTFLRDSVRKVIPEAFDGRSAD
jgi:phosphoenolpyruvate-protein phosphotransferase (PTS system enzyme I)